MNFIFDFEVFAHDWLVVFKNLSNKQYTVIHNDNEELTAFMDEQPFLIGFNNKHYDQFILKAILNGAAPGDVKQVNDFIIQGGNGWQHSLCGGKSIAQCDLMDDTQMGTSLKSIEAHLGMDITESAVQFDLDRPLTQQEVEQTVYYCKHDVDATEILFYLRKNYLLNKINLGKAKGISQADALYMTNAKLTAAYLDAVRQDHDDEREYQYPAKLRREYIPQEVFDFFDRLHDKSVSDDELFTSKLQLDVGGCPVTIGFGGIHGALTQYHEKETDTRLLINNDVGSLYPHLMTIFGYTSRAIPDPAIYEQMLARRMAAKKAHDTATANALKLVANTTYGAMLNQYNDLCDPRMGRSVCITGQLLLLELTCHIIQDCHTAKLFNLNTDGIALSIDVSEYDQAQEIMREWQERTGFELEEDNIHEIVQKDVNNYLIVMRDGSVKAKGGELVRGLITNGKLPLTSLGLPEWEQLKGGAFSINNNAVVIPAAVKAYLLDGVLPETTIGNDNDVLHYQIIAKASGKYSGVYHIVNGKRQDAQRCNRVYATTSPGHGTLYKVHRESGRPAKISGLPEHCIVDNRNEYDISVVNKEWYIEQAWKTIEAFTGETADKALWEVG